MMRTLLIFAALLGGCYLSYQTIEKTPENTGTVQLQDDETNGYVQETVEGEYVILPPNANGLQPHTSPKPVVTLQAVSGRTISFKTQNGQLSNGPPPQEKHIPYLVLNRNGRLTIPQERTINIVLSDVDVPQQGISVKLSITTQHGDPDLGGDDIQRIVVWQEERWVTVSEVRQSGEKVVFSIEFTGVTAAGNGLIPTPTDYFRFQLSVWDATNVLLHSFEQEYAFLMENQWVAQLPEVNEESPGAAPDELVIYYCDMFPFQTRLADDSSKLRREQVQRFVHSELVPAMVEAFYTQSQRWGFVWYQAWTSYSPGDDPERLNVALTDGQTWFHSNAAPVGHAGISINVVPTNVVHYGRMYYDRLVDKLMSVFQHELFHNHQRNIVQQYGGIGNVNGKDDAWQFFSEGTAVLASTIGQADMQLAQATEARDYIYKVYDLPGADLARDLAEIDFHHAALYWRFLYERCGGLRGDAEDPLAGMRIIQRSLDVLYSKEIVDIDSTADIDAAVSVIMDRALQESICPFKTYEDSLGAFMVAVDALLSESTN